MSFSFRSASSVGANSRPAASSFSLTLPTGWAAGDVAKYIVYQQTTTTAVLSVTSGWNISATVSIATSPGIQAAFVWKQLAAGDSAPTVSSTVSAPWNYAGGGYIPDAGSTVLLDIAAAVKTYTSGVTSLQANSAVTTGTSDLSVIGVAASAVAVGSTSLALAAPSGWAADGSNQLSGSGSLNAGQAQCAWKLGLSGSSAPGAGTSAVSSIAVVFQCLFIEQVSGTGSVAMNKFGLSGSGIEKVSGTGSVAMHKFGLSGSGAGKISATGSVALHKFGLSGAGTAGSTPMNSLLGFNTLTARDDFNYTAASWGDPAVSADLNNWEAKSSGEFLGFSNVQLTGTSLQIRTVWSGADWSSAWLEGLYLNRFAPPYYIEARAKCSIATGFRSLPLWTISYPYGTVPGVEIDAGRVLGSDPSNVPQSAQGVSSELTKTTSISPSDVSAWNKYGAAVYTDHVDFYVNDVLVQTITNDEMVSHGGVDRVTLVDLNVSMDTSDTGGSPSSSDSPQVMEVDYIAAWTKPITIGTGSVGMKKMGLSGAGTVLPVIVTLLNNFEGGTNGTTITTGNSGGGSGTAFDAVAGSPTYSTAAALQNSLGMSAAQVANSTSSVGWSSSFTPGFSSFRYRDYFKLPTIPTNVTRISQVEGSGFARWGIAIDSATGKIGVRNLYLGTFVALSSTVVTTATKHRYEVSAIWDGVAWTIVLKLFFGANADGITPDETLSPAAFGSPPGPGDTIRFGSLSSVSQTWTSDHDSIGLTNGDYIGPATAVFGSGSIGIKKFGLSGSGVQNLAGTGSVRIKKFSLSGSGAEKLTGTGSVGIKKFGLSGTGLVSAMTIIFGTGSISLHKMGLTITGTEIAPVPVNKRVIWDVSGNRIYQTGLDRGMLYIDNDIAVPWNGLVSVTEASDSGSSQEYFVDGQKVMDLPAQEDFAATIEAYSAPIEFAPCAGRLELSPGLYAANQPKKLFGFSYRTLIGNDLSGTNLAYKIHVVYNAQAQASDFSHATNSDKSSASSYSWSVVTVPVAVDGAKPTAHVAIDSRFTDSSTLAAIENYLYGDDTHGPRFPSISQLTGILQGSGIQMNKFGFFSGAYIGATGEIIMNKFGLSGAGKRINGSGSVRFKKPGLSGSGSVTSSYTRLIPATGHAWFGAYPAAGNADPGVFEASNMANRVLGHWARYYALDGTWPTATDESLVAAGRHLGVCWSTRLTAGGNALWKDVSAGTYDSALVTAANRFAAWGAPVFVGLDNEFDGASRQSLAGGGHGIADYAAYFRHVVNVVRPIAPNVIWCWCPTGNNRNTTVASSWPGDGFVDWILYDPYDATLSKGTPYATYEPFRTWINNQSFGSGKPVGIFETGIQNSQSESAKATWINQVPAALVSLDIRMWTWFNSSGGLGDTTITPGSASATALANIGANSVFH